MNRPTDAKLAGAVLIAIVDYDVGNVASIANMLKRIGQTGSVITRDPEKIRTADRIILPGVGAFDKGMRNLRELGLIDALTEATIHRAVPTLGICLGMHLMTDVSEEGNERGLGWIRSETRRFQFPPDSPLKVPHMGWNSVTPTRANALIPPGTSPRFYFVHGYYVATNEADDVIATASHGSTFTAAINNGNIFGVQFHPEKSHRFGMELLTRFLSA